MKINLFKRKKRREATMRNVSIRYVYKTQDDQYARNYDNMAQELRHYDTISYYPVLGMFVVFGFVIDSCNILKYSSAILIIALLYNLYSRFADTAAIFRSKIGKIEYNVWIEGNSGNQHTALKLFKFTGIRAKTTIKIITLLMILYISLNLINIIIHIC